MRKSCLLLLLMAFAVPSFAQESNCSNGFDDDGDGFIDCFDGDCAGVGGCQNTYTGNQSNCQIPQPPGSDFTMTLKTESEELVTSTHGRFVIGDMGHPVNGRDGIPEVVTAHTGTGKIYILDGQTLDVKYEATAQDKIDRYDIAIADVTNSGCAQLFVAEWGTERVCVRFRSDGSCREYDDVVKHYISSYDCQANLVWRREVYGRPFTLALADFDSDGMPELYYRNEILDAATGQTQVAGSGDWKTIDGGPVAVDILDDAECPDCEGLELVAGGQIYSVNLNAAGVLDSGSLTLVRQFNSIPGLPSTSRWSAKFLDLGGDEFVNSQTSIADYDLDGYLDVLMTGTSNSGRTTIFYWNVRNNQGTVYRPSNNWQYGAGRLNLADLDGDGQMNCAFVSGDYLYALDENLQLLWRIGIDEQSSGYTSTTVFDFNNDGASEIVYRDETGLYIIRGDGTFSPPINCKSLTSNDYPIVADVDADGSTEICVVCQDDFGDNLYTASNEGVIRTFQSGNEPWVSARQVWNQHGYFNVNINDDLTVPIVQQKHHLVFSQDQCSPGENRALNSFLNQSAILDTDGCKTYPAADVAFQSKSGSILTITPPTCPDVDFTVSFAIQNIGDIAISGNLPITFYSGDPMLPGATKLTTHHIALTNFGVGDSIDFPNLIVPGTGGAFTLFAVLNDSGTSVPTPIVLPNTNFNECNITNNIVSVSVNPQGFNISTAATDHVQCGASPSAPNGTTRAFKLEGTTEQTVGYTFYWFDGPTAGLPGSADYVGPVRTGLTNGTYTVYASHDAYQCGSDTVQVVVGLQTQNISATVTVDQAYTNCNSPDGQLSVTPDGGQPLNNYTYEWFEGTVFGTSPTLSDSSVLRFTQALTYSVLVTEKSSNCETLESGTVPDLTVTPTVTASTTQANCSPPNSGQAAATVGGLTAGYTFFWYDGSTSKPTEDFLGDTYSNITAGNYTVIAEDNTTGCASNETVVTVATVSGITASATITAHQTSCAAPNGSASANVGGTTAGYTFRWFLGNNTINEIGTGAVITGLAAGDYTVEATRSLTGCTDTELITIIDNISIPTVTPSVTAHQNDCFPPDGVVTAAAAGSPGPYTFYWFNGNIGTPDTTAANFKGAVYSGRTAGFYTVVAVDINTRCQSPRGLVEVLDQTVNPVITTTTTNQTSCNVAAPNGGAAANVGGVTAGYKFRWFSGSDTTTFITQSPAIVNRVAGTYTVKAVTLASGCFSTKLVVINDVSAKPTLSLTPQDNSVCSAAIGYTGSVSSAFLTNPNVQGGHTFVYEWRRNGVVIAGQTGASINGLNAAMYTATVTNQQLGCTSDPLTVEVKDVTILPVLETTFTASTNCIPSKVNGSAEVTEVDNVAVSSAVGYLYQWHTGIGTGSPINVGSNPSADDPKLLNVQGGAANNYTILVTNVGTGCQNTATVLVPDASEKPVITLSVTNNTVCDPALIAPPGPTYNGSVQVTTVTYKGAPFAGPGILSYEWFNGVGTGSPNGSSATATLGGLDNGSYSATVTIDDLGCESDFVSADVLDNVALPVLVTTSVPSTNCVAGKENGSAELTTVDGTPVGAATGYVYQWHTGAGTGSPIAVGTNPTADDPMLNSVQGGTTNNYTLQVTNESSGCQNTATVLVSDASEKPIITLTVTDNSVCDPSLIIPSGPTYNGSVQVASVTYKGAPFAGPGILSYEWFNGVGTGTPNGSSITATLGGLDNGSYSATVTIDDLGCESDFVSADVLDNVVLPVLATAATPSTNCVAGKENGSAEVTTVDGTAVGIATGYSYQWHTGAGTGSPIAVGTNPTADDPALSNVQGGMTNNYTVLATNESSGCQNTATVLVTDASEKPVITLSATDNTVCDPALIVPAGPTYNGSVQVVTIQYKGAPYGGPSTLTYQWFDGVGTGAPNGSSTTATLGNLDNGFFSATITIDDLGCESDFVSEEVRDNLTLPSIAFATTPSTNCLGGTDNGTAIATPTGLAGETFAYEWHKGNLISDPFVPNPDGGSAATIVRQQGGQNYTVKVTTNETGCVNNSTVQILDDSRKPVVTPLVFTHNTNCTAPFNGTASVDGVTPFTYHGATIGNPYAGFTFSWSSGTVNAAGDGITELGPGNYSLQVTAGAANTVTNNNDNCISDPVAVTIIDDLTYPVIDIAINDQSSCDVANPNGQLTATVGGGTAGYDFQWFEGPGTTGTDITDAVVPNIASDLDSDDYTSVVVNQTTGCASSETVFLPENIVIPSIAFGNVTDVTSCLAPNGTATPALAGVSTPATPDFTIYYVRTYSDASAPQPPPSDPAIIKASPDTYSSTAAIAAGVNPPVVTGLAPGFLTAIVIDNNTSCESSPATAPIVDATVANQVNLGVVTAAGFCGVGGGTMDITASGGTGPGTYAYQWYSGTPSNTNINFFNNPPDMSAAAFITNNEDLGIVDPVGGVSSGTYTLVVTDAVGCGTYLIDNVPFAGAPVVTVTPTDPERCTAPFDGQVDVQVVGTQNYSIVFFNGNNVPVPALSLLGEICDDGIDNDGDGLTDTADPDCNGTEICSNGIDDDGDLLIDALDPDCGNTTLTLTLADAGEYFIRVIDYTPANRACPLDQGVTLNQEGFAPTIQLDQINPNTACDLTQADGSVEITVSQDPLDQRDPVLTPIDFEVTSVVPAPVAPPAFPAALSSGVASVTATLSYGFGPQTYTLRITESTSGCFADQVVTIPNQPAVPDITVSVTDESFCAPNSNGNAQVTAVSLGVVDDYEFTWYNDVSLAPASIVYQANGTGLVPLGGELMDATKPGYTLGAAGQGAGNQTFYVRAQRLSGTGAGAGCNSQAVNVTIQDTHVTPTATLSGLPDTSCDPLIGEGSISITTVTNSPAPAVSGATYDYAINPDPLPVGVLANQSGALSTPFVTLVDDTYTVTALNRVSGCVVANDITLASNKYVISLTDTTITDKLICNPDGDVTVNEITIDRSLTSQPPQVFPASGALPANFEFRWFKGVSGTFTTGTPLEDGVGPTIIDGEVLTIGNAAGEYNDPAPDLGAGIYYVVARQVTGPGRFGANCESAPLMVEIKDQSVDPIITLTPFSNTSCHPTTFEGEIEVDVTDASTVPPGVYTFDYAWTALTAGRTAPNPSGNPYNGIDNLFTQVQDGLYELSATNTTTGCVATRQTTIQQNTTPIFVQAVITEAQLFCTPSGSLEVTTITYNDLTGASTNVTGAGLGDFTFQWFKDGTAPANVVGGATAMLDSAAGNYPGIGADPDFYVVATRVNNAPGLDCSSAPFRVEIKDERKFPVITLTPFSNTSCHPTTFEGEVEVDVTDPSIVPPGAYTFDYAWTALTAGRTAPNPSGNPYNGIGNLFTQVQDGLYELSATNTTTGCVATRQTTIQQNTTPIFVQAVISEAQLFCTPSGSLEVTTITYNDLTGASTNVTGAGLGDFTFQWFKDGTAPANVVGGATAMLDSAAGNYPGIGADPDYYVVATRVNNAPGLDCSSAPFRVEIKDERKFPVITLTPFSNTSCHPTTFEGEVEVDVTDPSIVPPGAYTFDYAWTALTAGRTAPNPSGNPYNGVANLFTQVQDGLYELSATNTTTGCVATRQTTIQQNTTPIFVQAVISEAQLFCTPSGSLEVTTITYNDLTGASTNVTGAGLVDFTFQWFKDGTAPANVVGGATAMLDSAAGNYPGIGADPDYYVVATRVNNAPGLDCSSAPFRAEIKDNRYFPVVNTATVANTTCNNNFDAAITVTAATAAGIGAGANYDIDWTADPGGAVVITDAPNTSSPYTTPASDNIGVGTYTLTVTNVVTQCSADAAVSVLQNTTPPQIWDVTKVDQTDCNPFNGSITVDTNDPAHVSVLGPYTFAWDKGGVPIAPAPVPDNILSGVDAGVYNVIGTKTSGVGAGCLTAPFSVTILDMTQRPAIELLSQANFACDPAMANGQISATVFEGSAAAPVGDYIYEWFAGKNSTTPPVIGNANTLNSQIAGDYTLRAVDNVSPNRGCDNMATTAIRFDVTSFSVTVSGTNQDLCSPLENGSLTITGITETLNGASSSTSNFANFDFQWFQGDGTPHSSTPAFVNAANAVNNLVAGNYYVLVRNALGCISTETGGIVDDQTILPQITLDNYLNPAICILPETPGFLQVSADNSLNFSDYIFQWFEGPDETGTMVEPNNATLGNIQYSQPLEYTVRVTNIATNCVNLDTYRFKVDTVETRVLASAVARTNCLVDDGSLFATTLSGTAALYDYEWYAGPSAVGIPVYTTKDVQGAPIGQYTVVAVNPNHSFCTSKPYTTRIPDQRVLPPVVATQKNPLTYCDPTNPNGVAFAAVNNLVSGYTFDWFQGSVGGAPIYTGSEITDLTATTYVVRATDVLTGCENTASIEIDNDPVNVAEPAVVIVSHHTNCVLDDGVLRASVDGKTAGYLLQWYDGSSVKNQRDGTGEYYRDLPQGFYTVTATDNISGCVSDPVSAEILPLQENPEFDIVTVPTNCEEDVGQATYKPLNEVPILSIEWNIGMLTEYGTIVYGLPKGEFTVTATTTKSCVATQTFTIIPEVLVFNGISRNNDGQNDIFEIACIADFPNNNVKIFNRAGTLVFEANGYDNQEVFFDGVSNRGISLLGTNLPDGTYFYIIDKRNGSEPKTGYLELLR